MLFARDGYAATRVNAIAAQAGTTSSFIYRAFGGKRALYKEAVHKAVMNVLAPGPSAALVVQVFEFLS